MAEPKPPITEIGSAAGDPTAMAGWAMFGGDAFERVMELQWPNSIMAYSSMMNDAQIQSLYHGLTLPIRAYWWYIDPNGAPPDVVERVVQDYNLSTDPEPTDEFKRRRGQRRFSFEKHLEDALRALQYGHYPFEQVGEIGEDQKWHLRKLSPRPPRTLTEINVAKDGALENIVQGYSFPNKITIPINRLVWYAWDREGANWTGRPMTRCVYRNYIVKDRVTRVGAINVERAGGVPYVEAPEGASGEQIRELDALARKFRVGEGAGAALPHGAVLKFAAAAGGDGAVALIKQQNEEMARAFLQMVSMLGQTNSGSRALGDTFHDILRVAQYTIAKWFCDIFNEHMLEDDVEWNEGPAQEFAPQLKFNAGLQDPMMGFREEIAKNQENPDTGLADASPAVAAMLGADGWSPGRRRRPKPAPTADRSGQGAEAGRVAASSEASPLLPARPLRRQPYPHEIQAQTDFGSLDDAYETALANLMNEVRLARSFQIDALHDAIAGAGSSISAVAGVTTDVSVTDRIRAHLEIVAAIAITQTVQEAMRQGVNVPHQSVIDISASLTARAEAVDELIRRDIIQSASREAVRLTGGGLSATEVADQTRTFLNARSESAMKDILGGAIQSSINEGRKLVFQRDGEDGILYASEILDTNTCGDCIEIDGTPYDNVADAARDYPTGHYRNCQGRERCRGTVLKVYTRDREPIVEDIFSS
jgi:hypothetical protein